MSTRQVIGLLAIVALLILFVVALVDIEEVGRQLRNANQRYLIASSFMLIIGLLAFAVRWRLLMANKPSLLITFHASNIGHAGNILIPARGGVLFRILIMGSSDAVSTTEATSGYVVERLFEQVMRLSALAGAIGLGVGIELSIASVGGGLGLVLSTFGIIFWLVKHPKIVLVRGSAWLGRLPGLTEARVKEALNDLITNLNTISTPAQFLQTLIWSLLTWACFWGFSILAALSLGEGFPPDEVLPISLGILSLSPPSAATQPGLFHASVIAPLAAVGYNGETLAAFAVILHILEMIWMNTLAMWGLAQMRISPRSLWRKIRR